MKKFYIENIKKLQFHFDFMKSLLPQEFHKEFEENAFISGGCIYSMFNNKEINDYDFFVRNEEFAKKLRGYFTPYLTKKVKYINFGEYKNYKLMVTKYAITIGNYQIITRFIGEPEEVVKQFDFKHNMFAFLNGDSKLKCFQEEKYLYDHHLHFNEERARDLCGTLLRVPKMVNKGFKVTKSEMSKILKKLDEKGFDDREREILKDYTTY